MKKCINKIIAIGICLSITNSSIIPVFAADNATNTISNVQLQENKKPVITLEEVIKSTLSNSDKLELKTKEITMYERKMELADYTKDYNEKTNQNANDDKIDDFPYDNFELKQKQIKQSKAFLEDQIANDITNKYNAIISKQMEIDKLKFDLEVKTKELDMLKIKVNIGVATSNQLYDKQIEINKAQDTIKTKEVSLKVNLDYLSILSDLDLSEYTLDSNIDFSTLKINDSVDGYLDDKVEQYLKYNEELVSSTNDYLKELKDEKIDNVKKVIDGSAADAPKKSDFVKYDATGAQVDDGTVGYGVALLQYERTQEKLINAYSSYLDARYNIDEAKVNLDNSKKSLKNTLKEMYVTLNDLENQINSLKDQIQSTNTKLRYAKTQVDIGVMTENNYKAQVVKSEELDIALRNLITTYNNLKNSIEKPWVLSSK